VQAPEPPRTLYKQFEAEYHAFCQRETGFDGRMDGAEGKALNEIIAYLTANSRTRNADGALKSRSYLLNHWHEVTPFLAKQKSLRAINKYLLELLETVRKATKKEAAKPVNPQVAAQIKKLEVQIDDARRSLKHFQTCAPYERIEQHREAAATALRTLETQLKALR
jgi:hypothetical protein